MEIEKDHFINSIRPELLSNEDFYNLYDTLQITSLSSRNNNIFNLIY